MGAIDLKEFPSQIYIYNDKEPRTDHGAIKDIVNKWDDIEIDERKVKKKFKPDIWQ